tara:strand:- start:2178 stop:2534 length:357 start_codon:yes stop_codon:yes gene_type:complete
MISVPVSIGELIDKITILEIKMIHIKSDNVKFELSKLNDIAKDYDCQELKSQLHEVNQELWNTEDSLRECERKGDFGENFITLARNVYYKNDERSRIKRVINETFNSKIVEEKSYSAY